MFVLEKHGFPNKYWNCAFFWLPGYMYVMCTCISCLVRLGVCLTCVKCSCVPILHFGSRHLATIAGVHLQIRIIPVYVLESISKASCTWHWNIFPHPPKPLVSPTQWWQPLPTIVDSFCDRGRWGWHQLVACVNRPAVVDTRGGERPEWMLRGEESSEREALTSLWLVYYLIWLYVTHPLDRCFLELDRVNGRRKQSYRGNCLAALFQSLLSSERLWRNTFHLRVLLFQTSPEQNHVDVWQGHRCFLNIASLRAWNFQGGWTLEISEHIPAPYLTTT